MRIDRCVCFDMLFADIIERAKSEGWAVEDIEAILGCGSGCGMCKPYIREGMKTGQVVFDKIIKDAYLNTPEP
jgi:bacterioferritin-associated ferredoxin